MSDRITKQILLTFASVILIFMFISIIILVIEDEGIYEEDYSYCSNVFDYSPKEATINCGPEKRYNFNVTISSKEEFVDFIRFTKIDDWVMLDNYKNSQGIVDWDLVLDSVFVCEGNGYTLYSLIYTPKYCSEGQEFILTMSNDGQVSLYGCCGK